MKYKRPICMWMVMDIKVYLGMIKVLIWSQKADISEVLEVSL